MKRLLIFLQSIVLLALCCCLHAHHDCGKLGHHWHDPAYIGEVRLQTVVMVAIVCIISATSFIRVMLKNRSAGR